MIKFEGSILYDFDGLPFIYNDREYWAMGVAEVKYDGESQVLISKAFMGHINCEVDGFIELWIEDENEKPPVIVTPEMMNLVAETLAEVHADKLIDACASDALKWIKDDNKS